LKLLSLTALRMTRSKNLRTPLSNRHGTAACKAVLPTNR
jgi:hypothetical protein